MSRSPARHLRSRCLPLVVGAGLVGALLSTGGAASAAPEVRAAVPQPASGDVQEFVDGSYIVHFADEPAATYDGGVAGLAATAPEQGAQIAPRSAEVRRYAQHLRTQQDAALAEVGATPFYRYTTVLNGVAAELTAEQARALAKSSGVRAVVPDGLRQLQTDTSPDVLGLAGRFWRAAGGQDDAGSGVVVGVIDSGIWPENPSFAPNDTPVPPDWTGECVAGEEFTADACNGKIIGARYYTEGFGPADIAEEDYLSPRDGDGHGSHTASTAAGNHVEDVVVDGTAFGDVSGMAPGAKIAAYKVCWTGVAGDGCANSDSAKAIEDAVNDGVDVINFSIGGSSESTVIDEVELAFLNAAAAGVFVSASAGNNGPGESTLDHPSPWLTTVAASTHKVNEAVLELADGRRFLGASSTGLLPELTPMVLAAESAAPGVNVVNATLCALGSLDPALVTGRLVVCERGVVDRTEKSRAVAEAGGAGMVLINPTENSVNADLHFVPSVHLDADAYEPVTTYVADGADPRGRIVAVAPGESTTAVPEVADFSSRGPSTTTGGDILKPDISAPGVDVLAAVAPPFHVGRDYDLLSGTSMAAPHIAGLAAVLIQLNPDWSPMAVKSALMTTAIDHVSTSDPFDQGAGFVQPEAAMNPGLVFDHGVEQWIGYLEHETGLDLVPEIAPLDGSQINQASVAIGALAGRETVRRTVTNVSGRTMTYRALAAVPGVDVQVSPRTVRLKAGESATVDVTFVRGDAVYDEFTTGTLRFVGNRNEVRVPLAVRPVAAAVQPAEVRGTGTDGSAPISVTSGFTGTMTTSVAGLVGATPEQDAVTEDVDAFDPAQPSDAGEAVDSRTLTVGEGTTLLRASVDGSAAADLDLWLYRLVDGAPELVGLSATGSADEEVTLVDPAPGEYVAYVHGFAVPAPADGAYSATQWVVGSQAEGNLSVVPQSRPVRVGEAATFTATWSGLDPAQRYLGWVGFYDGETLAGRSIVAVG